MNQLKIKYQQYRNGIIFTLVFHIILFIILNVSQFRKKQEFKEPEIFIDFKEQIKLEEQIQTHNQSKSNDLNNEVRTNFASNRATENQNKKVDQEFQQELEQARNLVKEVSQQLSKEIPTVDDLKMPEKKNDENNSESLINKQFTGDSNVEYYLKDRYHIRLPIPVYLAQYAGVVKVNIVVDKAGNVIEANPVVENNSNPQLLSFAKTAALRTKFNKSTVKEENQRGYIQYHFIAQ